MTIELKPIYPPQPKSMVPRKATIIVVQPVTSPRGDKGTAFIGDIPNQQTS